MAKKNLSKKQSEIVSKMQVMLKTASWTLYVTKVAQYPEPKVEIVQHIKKANGRKASIHYGFMHNGKLNYCKDVIRLIISNIVNERGELLELNHLLDDKLSFRGHIPLDDEAGAKLALLFSLQSTILDKERVELMAWRIERFSREESLYWLNKISVPSYGDKSLAWAKVGLRTLLGGRMEDKDEILNILTTIRK